MQMGIAGKSNGLPDPMIVALVLPSGDGLHAQSWHAPAPAATEGRPKDLLSTGSLGHGLGVGVGMAKALKLAKRSPRVFVLISDGECDEGTTWEAALFAQHHQLDNLVVIIDYNKIQKPYLKDCHFTNSINHTHLQIGDKKQG